MRHGTLTSSSCNEPASDILVGADGEGDAPNDVADEKYSADWNTDTCELQPEGTVGETYQL